MSADGPTDTRGDSRQAMMRTIARAKLLRRIRPTSVVSPLLRLLGQRAIVDVEGLRIFADPTSHLGGEILTTGSYEPDTIRLFRQQIRPGAVVLDIGANEGFFAALAGRLAGPAGTVIAVEPQSRLADVLEINLALNAPGRVVIVNRILAETDDDTLSITLFPISNTGASSVIRKYRFGGRTEAVRTITPATILREAAIDRVDFVKIDVEGFEPEVIRSMQPLFEAGRVSSLLLDYHRAILDRRGIDPMTVHQSIVAHGFPVAEGAVGDGYVLYTQA